MNPTQIGADKEVVIITDQPRLDLAIVRKTLVTAWLFVDEGRDVGGAATRHDTKESYGKQEGILNWLCGWHGRIP